MPRDFAGRGGPAQTRKHKQSRHDTRPRRQLPTKGVLFHGPSFSSGAIVGALIVILAAYAPELLREAPAEAPVAVAPAPAEPKLTFEFPDLLRHAEVKTDPDTYKIPASSITPPPQGYFVQAASFLDASDAEALRANLLLAGMQAKTSVTRVNGAAWHRVVVGPLASKAALDRAMHNLRNLNLGPMRLNNPD